MKAMVQVALKDGVLDPQGLTVKRALEMLGFHGVAGVRMGKWIELDVTATDRASVERDVHAMCQKLLANPVTERFTVQVAG